MGCDIHLYVEKKRKGSEGFSPCGFCSRFSDRVYGMFAMLADVRNYDNKYPHITIRGLPDDVSWNTSSVLGNPNYECNDGSDKSEIITAINRINLLNETTQS